MEHIDAVELIKNGIPKFPFPQRWIDLGCGRGTFTYALTSILPPQSTIIAIDRDSQNLAPNDQNKVYIEFRQMDFENDTINLSDMDGILMANSLHFIKDKISLITELNGLFKDMAHYLIVEYDTDQANPWVPYPISFNKLKELFLNFDGAKIEWVGDRDSMFNGNKIYSATIKIN